MMTPLERLKAGNRRFASGEISPSKGVSAEQLLELSKGQAPFAAVLCCADSRVAPEIIFDQGLGDLFVLRVAGNLATPEVIGSLELGVAGGIELIVVVGHSSCLAIQTALGAVDGGDQFVPPSQHQASLVDPIRPAVEASLKAVAGDGDSGGGASSQGRDEERILKQAVERNARASAARLLEASRQLLDSKRANKLVVMAAAHNLETGLVEFFEDSTAVD